MSNSESKREQLQHQRMPSVDWEFQGTTIQSAAPRYLPLPKVVECWEEFDLIQDKFLSSMDREYTRFPPVDIRNIIRPGEVLSTEFDVKYCYVLFMSSVLDLLDLQFSRKSEYKASRRIEGKQKGTLETGKIMERDLHYTLDVLFLRMNKDPVVVIETKRVTFFRKDRDEGLPDLVVNDKFDISKRQIFTYMSCTKTGYGILSSGDSTFFLKRETTDNGESVLKISKCILWEDLLIPMAAFFQTAYEDMGEYNEEPERIDSFTQSDEHSEEKESSPEEDDDETYRPYKKTKKAGPSRNIAVS